MKKTIMLLAVAAMAIGVPVFGQATEDTNNCVTSGTAAPTPGGTQQNLGPVDPSGTAYAQQGTGAAGRIGARGAHGWVQLSGDAATQTGRLEGRNSDTGLSGYIIFAGANSKICVSAPPYVPKTKPLG